VGLLSVSSISSSSSVVNAGELMVLEKSAGVWRMLAVCSARAVPKPGYRSCTSSRILGLPDAGPGSELWQRLHWGLGTSLILRSKFRWVMFRWSSCR